MIEMFLRNIFPGLPEQVVELCWPLICSFKDKLIYPQGRPKCPLEDKGGAQTGLLAEKSQTRASSRNLDQAQARRALMSRHVAKSKQNIVNIFLMI